tara:strand:+ start:20813 stop:21040 length:228 start_codon:yes stop_codon:yes gene_type:complete
MITHFEVIADGVVQVFAGGGMVAQVDKAKTLGYVMNMYGMADETKIKGGNGMPFDDAIIDEAIAIYNWETNGVAG